jgi:hypothetical protein
VADDVIRIKVQGEVYDLDFDGLAWGELEEIEDIMGCPLEDANFATAKGVLCLAFVAVRKRNPAMTMDSLKALPVSEIELVETEGNPTVAVVDGEDESSGNPS